jgi:hypothetical protein
MYSLHSLEQIARARCELPADCMRNPAFFDGGPMYGRRTIDEVMLSRYSDLLDRRSRSPRRQRQTTRRFAAAFAALLGRKARTA